MTGPLAVIAGIALSAYRRARDPVDRSGWTIHVIPSQSEHRHDLKGIWKKVMYHIDRAPHDGVHLFLAHGRESERPAFKELNERSYRAVWLPAETCRQYGQPAFRDALNRLMNFEEQWRGRIRPSVNSPLLLPEGAFAAARHVSEIWQRARLVHEKRDNMAHVANAVSRFRQEHWRGSRWIDEQQLAFRRGSPHASHIPCWRKRKLTFDIPVGLHFDVWHERGRRFRLKGRAGWRDFVEYTNVDPHGFIRGGS